MNEHCTIPHINKISENVFSDSIGYILLTEVSKILSHFGKNGKCFLVKSEKRCFETFR